MTTVSSSGSALLDSEGVISSSMGSKCSKVDIDEMDELSDADA